MEASRFAIPPVALLVSFVACFPMTPLIAWYLQRAPLAFQTVLTTHTVTWCSIMLPSVLLFFLAWVQLIRFVQDYLWTPWKIKRVMAKQGVSGPNPHFISGNTRDIAKMIKEVASRDMECHNHDVVERFLPQLSRWSKIYGKTFLFWWGNEPGIFISEPHLVRELMTLSEGSGPYCKAASKERTRYALFGNGLFSLTGKAWELQRAVVAPAFHQNKLKRFVEGMAKCSSQLVDNWEKTIAEDACLHIDVSQEFMKVTANIIASTAFGSSYQKGKRVFEQMNQLQKLTALSDLTSFPGKRLFPTSLNRKIWRITREMNPLLTQIVQERMQSVLSESVQGYGDDLLGMLLSSVQPKANHPSIYSENVIGHCKSFYFAGYETTALLLTWTLMLLSQNPEWQQRAREEILELMKRGPIDSEMLRKMKIMGMILNESLRLYPPTGVTVRQTSRDAKLGDLFIPKGMVLWIPMVALHHDPQLWGSDAHEFRPERFANGVAGATNRNLSFIPFGHGPRSCLGSSFAIMEAKVVLAMILSKFRCRLSPNYNHAPVSLLTLKPLHGMPIILEKLPEEVTSGLYA
eukprot:c5011_g1_i1 orf=336-2060(+)